MFRGDDIPPRRRNVSHLNTTTNFFNENTVSDAPRGKRHPSVDNAFDRSTHEVQHVVVRKQRGSGTVKNNESSYSLTKFMGHFGDEVRSKSPKKFYPWENKRMYVGTNTLGIENKKCFSDMRLNFNSIRKVHTYLDSSNVLASLNHNA